MTHLNASQALSLCLHAAPISNFAEVNVTDVVAADMQRL